MKKIIFILLLIISISSLFSAGVISVKEAAKLSKSGDAIIVSAREKADYDKKHIKNAVNIYHKDLYKADGVESMLKTPAEIAKIFGEKGISVDSKIIIYDNGDNKLAGRLFWIFEYLGAKDVNLLDGHLKGWMKGRKPVTKNATKVSAVEFKVAVDNSKIVTMPYVKSILKKSETILVDVRSKEEFDGTDEDEKLKRNGHIPGAINIEYKTVVNENGTIKSKEEISKILADNGITSDKEIIIYCGTAVRAGIFYMALTSVMGYDNVKVFDGAFYEWDSDSSNPIE